MTIMSHLTRRIICDIVESSPAWAVAITVIQDGIAFEFLGEGVTAGDWLPVIDWRTWTS